jgi:hypothetical protein
MQEGTRSLAESTVNRHQTKKDGTQAAEKLFLKQDRLLLARFVAVLKRYKIDPAAYHGGNRKEKRVEPRLEL